MSTDANAPRFQVCKMGPRCWYVQDTRTGELVSPTLPTRKLAMRCVADRNEVA